MNDVDVTARIHHTVKMRNFITIEENCEVGENSFIGNCVTMRKNTKIGERVKIGHCAVFEGDCKIGNDCVIQAQSNITRGMIVEDKVFIGQMVCFGNDKEMKHLRGPWKLCAPVVREWARIGMGSTILPGVEIAEGTVIGAGSVVTKSTEPWRMYYGNPARDKGPVPDRIGME